MKIISPSLVFVRFFFSQIINRSGIKDMKMFTYIMNGVNQMIR
jgi:hypothetical protein